MNTGIIILLLCACVLVYLLAGSVRNGIRLPSEPLGMIPSASELFRQKCELEQKMASVAGGKTGLIMLLDTLRNDPACDASLYRDSCLAKQAELKRCIDEYDALLRQTAALPPEERLRFAPPEELAQYRQLLEQEIDRG